MPFQCPSEGKQHGNVFFSDSDNLEGVAIQISTEKWGKKDAQKYKD